MEVLREPKRRNLLFGWQMSYNPHHSLKDKISVIFVILPINIRQILEGPKFLIVVIC